MLPTESSEEPLFFCKSVNGRFWRWGLFALIAPLCGIEKLARESGLSAETRKKLRQMNAPAMLDRLHRRLIELQLGRVGSPVLQKSPLGQAIQYTLGQLGGVGALPRIRPV